MKLKADVLNVQIFPWGERIITTLNGKEFHLAWIEGIVINHLKVPREKINPASYYTQHCDRGWGGFCDKLGIEVRLSGVSRTRARSGEDFDRALEALANLYKTRVASVTPIGESVNGLIVIMMDKAVETASGKEEVLLEVEFWVEGTAPAA